MRLIVAFVWSVATLMWLPWFTVLVRFIIDLISGTPWSYSEYLTPALIAIWPVRGWLGWELTSWWPLVGLLAMLLTWLGWRVFWWEQDWRPSHSFAIVLLSILLPPLALVLLYGDARRRYRERNAELHAEVDDALEALERSETLRLI